MIIVKDAAEAPPAGVAPGHARVVLAITVVALLFVSMLAVVYYRSWWKAQSPSNAMLVVSADPGSVNVSIMVLGSQDSWTDKLSAENRYRCQFVLPPGNYRVKATCMGITQESELMTLRAGGGQEIRLTVPKLPGTQPAEQ